MRADNQGEGGILALFALAQRRLIIGSRWAKIAVGLALAGTAFFFCDALDHAGDLGAGGGRGPGSARARTSSAYVIPVTIGVIVALFAYQHRGTARVARLFGPIMVVWFIVIAVIGAIPLIAQPRRCSTRSTRMQGLALLLPPPAGGARDHRRGVPRHHRRGGAVRGHGALRQAAGAHRLVCAGGAGAGHQLLRPGRDAARGRPPDRRTRSITWCPRSCCRGW